MTVTVSYCVAQVTSGSMISAIYDRKTTCEQGFCTNYTNPKGEVRQGLAEIAENLISVLIFHIFCRELIVTLDRPWFGGSSCLPTWATL